MSKTIWVDVKGYEDLYSVSNLGCVKSKRTGKKIKPYKYGGYYRICLSKNGIVKTALLHRLVAEHFVSRIGGLDAVKHKDGNQFNCQASNLEWTSKSLIMRKLNMKLKPKNKLTEEQICEIIKLRKSGVPFPEIGFVMNLPVGKISRAYSRYKNVDFFKKKDISYVYYSPRYELYVDENKQIYTKDKKQVNIYFSKFDGVRCVRVPYAERLSIYSINKDLIRLDGRTPFKRPFGNVNKKDLMNHADCVKYIGQLHEQGMSNKDLAIAFGCTKDTITKKIHLHLSGVLYE